MQDKHIFVIAGPAGSGKDALAQELLKRSPRFTLMVSVTTRTIRPSEQDGVNYHYFTKDRFEKEIAAGTILEHYHRTDTDTYYGTYKPDIDTRLASGKIVIAVIQIVGAKYIKEHYGATTIFIMPPPLDVLEKRIRTRSPMSDIEWRERMAFTKREVEEEAPWYDYRITNADGKLSEAADHVIEILQKEGYTLD